ncbi:hypothetical protein WJM97_10830 [Okeanomitos corallinicola TIOX110]|uniref:Tetratricopeptide repeat protein n=1 Tax=Okeanomitos corallinicola TIOX110 TaxID=3133117 RepID=A0ABZ2UXK5_9CYAN
MSKSISDNNLSKIEKLLLDLKQAKAVNDHHKQAQLLMNLGSAYYSQGDYEQAFLCY